MIKLLLLGSRGFLGSHVLNKFNNSNHQFQLLTPSSKELNLLDEIAVQKYLWENKPNYALMLSAICGGIGINARSSADFLVDNLSMGIHLYRNAQKYGGVEKIYSVGSVCSYPRNCPTPFKEEDLWSGYPEITNAGYGNAKRMLLLMSQTYRQQYGLGGAFFIPVNMYGTMDNFAPESSHVIPALIKKFLDAKENNTSVKCFGTGTASREFLNVSDCADILVQAITSNFDHPEPINLGTGKSILIIDLAELIAELVGFKGDIIFTGEISDGQPRRQLNVEKAKALLNWEAKTDLKTGLIKTIEWYKENRGKL